MTGIRITLHEGDITRQAADAVVNAANSSLLGGGGVNGAIHRRGGPGHPGRVPVAAGGPVPRRAAHRPGGSYHGRRPAGPLGHPHGGPGVLAGEDRSALLASCYTESLRVADELGAEVVAFPAVSAGIYGWPAADAARIALAAARGADTAVREARFVLFGRDMHQVFAAALATLPTD